MHGNVQSVRGMVQQDEGNWDSPYATGPTVNSINWDINVVTGVGAIWGTGVHEVTAVPGGRWHCAFGMRFTNGGAGFAGKGACYGSGPLLGWFWTVDLIGHPDGSETATGYILQPGH